MNLNNNQNKKKMGANESQDKRKLPISKDEHEKDKKDFTRAEFIEQMKKSQPTMSLDEVEGYANDIYGKDLGQ